MTVPFTLISGLESTAGAEDGRSLQRIVLGRRRGGRQERAVVGAATLRIYQPVLDRGSGYGEVAGDSSSQPLTHDR